MLIPVTLFILYINVCEELMFKNRGGDDAEGFLLWGKLSNRTRQL